jgi:hypothetical protein
LPYSRAKTTSILFQLFSRHELENNFADFTRPAGGKALKIYASQKRLKGISQKQTSTKKRKGKERRSEKRDECIESRFQKPCFLVFSDYQQHGLKRTPECSPLKFAPRHGLNSSKLKQGGVPWEK